MAGWILRGALLLLVLFLGALFVVQNATLTSPLGLNLGFAAWELREPAPVPALMVGSMVVGLALGAAWGLTRGRKGGRTDTFTPSTSGPDW